MKITSSYISQLVPHSKANMDGDADEHRMLNNLRSSAIESLVGVLRELEEKASVMGVNAVDVTPKLQDCIQTIQEKL